MSDVNIKATLSVEAGNSAKSINDLKSELVATKKSMDSAAIGSDAFKKAQSELATKQKELTDATKTANEASGGLAGTFGKLKEGLGGMVPGFNAVSQGASGLVTKFWELVKNPWGALLTAIVVTLKFLYEAFQSSVEGGKELKAIFAALSAIGTQLKDAFFGFARALIDVYVAAYKFITLDFKGASAAIKKANNEATESYKQLGNAVNGTTAKIIYDLEKQQQAVDKARKQQAVTQSQTNKLLVQSRETLTDETASMSAKKKALEEVTRVEKASSAERVRIAAEDLRIAKARAKAMGGEEEKKAKQQLRELTIALNEAETENAMTGIKLNKQRKMLNRQEIADEKEKNDAIRAANKERADAAKQKLAEEYNQNKLDLDSKLKDTKLNFDERRKLVADDHLLNVKDRAKYNQEINDAEKAAIEKHKQDLINLENKYKTNLEDLRARTDQQKLDLQMQRDLAELDQLGKTEEEKAKIRLLIQDKYAILQADLTKKTNDDIDAKNDAQAQKLLDNEVKILEARKSAQYQFYDAVAGAIGSLGSLFAKGTAASKVAALAEIAIGTGTGFIKGLNIAQDGAEAGGPAAPFLFPIFYATQISAVLGAAAKAKNILSQVKGGGSGSTASAPSAAAPIAPAAVATQLTATTIQGIGNAATGGTSRAYVLDSDIKDNEERNARINRAARII